MGDGETLRTSIYTPEDNTVSQERPYLVYKRRTLISFTLPEGLKPLKIRSYFMDIDFVKNTVKKIRSVRKTLVDGHHIGLSGNGVMKTERQASTKKNPLLPLMTYVFVWGYKNPSNIGYFIVNCFSLLSCTYYRRSRSGYHLLSLYIRYPRSSRDRPKLKSTGEFSVSVEFSKRRREKVKGDRK